MCRSARFQQQDAQITRRHTHRERLGRAGECVAIEIELNAKANPDHVIENLERAAAVDFIDRILCLVPTEPDRKHIRKCVTASGLLMKKPILVDRIWKHMEA